MASGEYKIAETVEIRLQRGRSAPRRSRVSATCRSTGPSRSSDRRSTHAMEIVAGRARAAPTERATRATASRRPITASRGSSRSTVHHVDVEPRRRGTMSDAVVSGWGCDLLAWLYGRNGSGCGRVTATGHDGVRAAPVELVPVPVGSALRPAAHGHEARSRTGRATSAKRRAGSSCTSRTARSRWCAATATTCSATGSCARRAPRSSSSRPIPTASASPHDPRRRRRGARSTWDEAFALIDAAARARSARSTGPTRSRSYLGNPNAHNLGPSLYNRVLLQALGHAATSTRASTVDQMPKQVSAGLDVRRRARRSRSPTSTAPTTS